MIRGLILAILLALGGLIGTIFVRTMNYGPLPQTTTLSLPDVPEFDSNQIAEHLGRAIQFKTITLVAGDPRQGLEGPWLDLHAWLAETYPHIHQAAVLTHIADLTLLYEWKGTNPTLDPILLMAHQDVVPVNIGTEKNWTAPPFEGRVVGDHIYGRGTLDNKASLVALMEAADALAASGFQPERTILIMFGHDEEVSGSGARAGVAHLKAKGVRAEMVVDEGYVVVEKFPATGKPAGLIGIAEKGYITVKLTSSATGGHSSTPPRNSANVQLAKAIIALDSNQMPADFSRPPISEMLRQTSVDMPFITRMALANMWLFRPVVEAQFAKDPVSNAMMRTTTAPTIMSGSVKENVLPQMSVALVNFRVHPNDTPDSVLAHVRNTILGIDGVTADFDESGGVASPASPVSPTDSRAYKVLAAVATQTGDGAPAVPALVLGATDARWTSEISDNVYRFAPSVVPSEDLAGFHGTNERLSVANLGRLAHGYATIMKTMASE